jgi:hypothetical protein
MFDWRRLHRPRRPLARLVLASFAAVGLAIIVVLGLVALLALVAIGGVIALGRGLARASSRVPATTARDVRVIEGEYVVLRDDGPRHA